MASVDRIGRRVKLQELDVLMTVVDAGSMGKAARRLNTSQPAISRSIADLENAIGVRLLERSPRGIRPTTFGRALIDCGTAVFDELNQGLRTIEFLSDPTAGELRIAGNEPIIAGILPAIFTQLRQSYPGISIHVFQAPTLAQQIDLLCERRIDFVLARITPPTPPQIHTEVLYDERWYVVARANGPLARRRKLTFADLIGEPWALPWPETVVGSIFTQAFHDAGFEYPIRNVAFGAIHLHLTLAANGPFLALVPDSILRFGADRFALKVLPVPSPVRSWPVGFMTLKNRTIGPIAQRFMDCARQVTKPLAKQR